MSLVHLSIRNGIQYVLRSPKNHLLENAVMEADINAVI